MELTFFLALLIKHAIVDIGIQGMQGPLNKANYYSKLAQYHYGLHGIATFFVALMFVGPVTALLAGIIDWLAHWHIDFVKSTLVKRSPYVKYGKVWLWLTSIDQLCHYITYYSIIVLL